MYLLKTVGYSVWALAFALSVALAWDFHQGQNHIALGVAVLALIVSASGLLMARYSWQRGDYLVMFLGLGLWLAGAVSFTFTELGFWTSSYNERHAEYVQVKAVKTRQEGLTDRAWNALTTGEMPPSPAEIKARINAAQQHERWGPSKGCTDATVTESRVFCEGYFELQAQFAAAEQRQKFESQILGGNEQKVQTSYVHDVFALAASLARWLGTDDEKQAAEYIILSTWILLLLARDTGLLIANPLGRRKEPPTAALRKPDTEPQVDPKPPVLAHPAPSEKAPELALQHRPVVQVAVPLKVREDPHRKIAFSKDDLAQFPKLVSSKNAHPKAQEPKPTNEKMREGCVIDWIHDCTSTTPDRSAKVASGEAYKESYLQWCRLRNLHPIGQSKFTRKLVAQFKVKERKRDAITGTRYIPGLLLHKPQVELQRKVA